MSKEAMKLDDKAVAQILSRLPSPPVGDGSALHAWAMQVVRKLAEQPAQQEPVAMWDGKYQIEFGNLSAYKHGEHSWIPLYTSPQPAQRTWVALTDEERIMCRSYDPEEAVTKTEAKLEEKNT